MADVSPNFLRGFIVPKKITSSNLWDAQSTFTQQGNLSGDPVPQQNSRLVVRSSGNQNVGSDLSIVSRRSGHVDNGAAFTFINNDTSDDFGQNAFNAADKWNVIKWYSNTVGFQETALTPYPLDLGDGSCLVVTQNKPSGTERRIVCNKRSESGTFSSVVVFSFLSSIFGTLTQNNHPNLLRLDNGDILCFFLFEDTTAQTVNLMVFRSSDDGSTWNRISRSALNSEISVHPSTGYEIKRMRSAQYAGEIIVLIETVYNDGSASTRNRLHQYASIDGGGRFRRVTIENLIDDYPFFQVDIFTDETQGNFCMTYIDATNSARFVRIPHAHYDVQSLIKATQFKQITSGSVATGSSALLAGGQSTSFNDVSGNIYVIFQGISTPDFLYMMVSTDEGQNFTFMNGRAGSDSIQAAIFNLDDTGTLPQQIKCIPYAGSAILCSNWLTTSSFIDSSATMIFLGGFANVNQPIQTFGNDDDIANRAGYNFTFYPVDLPADVSSITVGGSGTQTLSGGKLVVSTNTTQTISYTVPRTTIRTNIRITGKIALEATSGGSITGPFPNGLRKIQIKSSNGTNNYDVEIRISQTQLQGFDNIAGAGIGSIKTIVGADGVEIFYAIENGKMSLYYRQYTQATANYITAFSGQTISDGGSSTNTEVIFTHSNSPAAGTLDTNILYWFNGFEDIAGEGLGKGFSSPGDLVAAPYPPRGVFKYVADGVSITTQNGPAYEGDSYRIQTRYEYPINNIFYDVSPTPRVKWRSQSVTSGSVPEQLIPILLDSTTSTANSMFSNDIIGVYLGNINFREFTVEYYDVTAGAWQVLKTVDASQGLTFNYTSEGNQIIGVNGGTNEPYVFYNEFSDSIVELTIGGTVERYRILSHSEGKAGTTDFKRPVFELSGRPSGNGTCRIIPKNVSIVANLLGKRATAFAVRISSNPSIDNYFCIGSMIIGPMVLTGNQYSFGRSITLESNIAEYETNDRVRYARKVGPPRRNIRIAWTEGVDISSLMGISPTPDVWTGSTSAGAEKIATRDDTPYLVMGLIDYLEGAVNPVVYLPSIQRSESSGTDIQIINRYHDMVFCTIDPESSIDNVLGDENLSSGGEVFRVATLNMVEVI